MEHSKKIYNFRMRCLDILVVLVCCMTILSSCCLIAILYLFSLQKRYMDEFKSCFSPILKQLNNALHKLFMTTYKNTVSLIESCGIAVTNLHTVFSQGMNGTEKVEEAHISHFIQSLLNYQVRNLVELSENLKNLIQKIVSIAQSLREQIIRCTTVFVPQERCETSNVQSGIFTCSEEMSTQIYGMNGCCRPRFVCPRILPVTKYPGTYGIPRHQQVELNGMTTQTEQAKNRKCAALSLIPPPIEEQWKVRMPKSTLQDQFRLNNFRFSEEKPADPEEGESLQADTFKIFNGHQANIDARRDQRMTISVEEAPHPIQALVNQGILLAAEIAQQFLDTLQHHIGEITLTPEEENTVQVDNIDPEDDVGETVDDDDVVETVDDDDVVETVDDDGVGETVDDDDVGETVDDEDGGDSQVTDDQGGDNQGAEGVESEGDNQDRMEDVTEDAQQLFESVEGAHQNHDASDDRNH